MNFFLSTKHTHRQHQEIVACNNATKSGVDNLEKLVRTYHRQRKCLYYSVFMALVDLAVIAAMKAMHALSHYSFKLDLGYEMTLPLSANALLYPT